MRAVLPLLLLSTACSDYIVRANKDDPTGGGADSGGVGDDTGDPWAADRDCPDQPVKEAEVGQGDNCDGSTGGFNPIVEWEWGTGNCTSQPLVADLVGDSNPEIIVNHYTGLPPFATGTLSVVYGDGSGTVWSDPSAKLAYGSPPAVADIDGDGDAEIIVVREYASSLYGAGDYRAAAYTHDGTQLWETTPFVGLDFDWASAPVISDMDHDGTPEIVIGRVILRPDGTVRGIGEHGRGSYGIVSLGDFNVSESSVPAVADLDLDGQEEVIVGNAMYAVDGSTIWYDPSADDGMISIANLDEDEAGEFIAITYNTIRAVDTDGSALWGPTEVKDANILATAAVGDIDLDGRPEIITAGGNKLVAFNHDGTVLWQTKARDESGATGASIFDFEGDGWPEVVYIDEQQMVVHDGLTGAVKFYNGEHGSATMFDYPTVADVDSDDQAEIVVCHGSFGSVFSVYGDQEQSWRPARPLWNQHAYSIGNINDDLSVPADATPSFQATNTWHSAIPIDGTVLDDDLSGEILDVCEDDCEDGALRVQARLINRGAEATTTPVKVALYARDAEGRDTLLATHEVEAGVEGGWATRGFEFNVAAADVQGAVGLWFAVDDDGTGTGVISECSESDNGVIWNGPFCTE